MSTLAEVRAELADICAAIPGWRSSGWVGDAVTEPMIKVARPAFDPRLVFGSDGKKSVTFRLTAYVKRADTERAEKMLDALAEPSGSGSLIAAVQTSSNWSITVDFAQVVNVGETAAVTFGDGVEYLACPFDVEVVW